MYIKVWRVKCQCYERSTKLQVGVLSSGKRFYLKSCWDFCWYSETCQMLYLYIEYLKKDTFWKPFRLRTGKYIYLEKGSLAILGNGWQQLHIEYGYHKLACNKPRNYKMIEKGILSFILNKKWKANPKPSLRCYHFMIWNWIICIFLIKNIRIIRSNLSKPNVVQYQPKWPAKWKTHFWREVSAHK